MQFPNTQSRSVKGVWSVQGCAEYSPLNDTQAVENYQQVNDIWDVENYKPLILVELRYTDCRELQQLNNTRAGEKYEPLNGTTDVKQKKTINNWMTNLQPLNDKRAADTRKYRMTLQEKQE